MGLFNIFKRKKKELPTPKNDDDSVLERQIREVRRQKRLMIEQIELENVKAELDELQYELYGEDEDDENPLNIIGQQLLQAFISKNPNILNGNLAGAVNLDNPQQTTSLPVGELSHAEMFEFWSKIPIKEQKLLKRLPDDKLKVIIAGQLPQLNETGVLKAIEFIHTQ